MENKIVVHMKDGVVHKGVTHDFRPDAEAFHLLPAEGGGVPIRVTVDAMKALFYVKDYLGNRDFKARRQFEHARRDGRRAVVKFADGEEVWGFLGEGYDDEGTGFFFFPVDTEDNNLRIFVIRSAMKELQVVA